MSRRRRDLTALVLVVAAPLVVFDPAGWFPFGPSKWLAVSVGVPLALLVVGEVRFHRRTGWVWSAFLVWAALAASQGSDPLHAWIGTPDRHLGWLTWVLFSGAFGVGGSIIDRRMLGPVAVVTLAGVAVYSGLEWLGSAPVTLASRSVRLGGPFGSPAYLGAAMVLLIPVVAAVGFDAERSRRWRVAATASGLGGVAVVIGTQTRAALVGLLVAGVVVAARIGWRRTLVAGVIGLAVIAVSPVGQRAVSALSDPTETGRFAEWGVGLRVLAAEPVLGVGPEGYRVVFPQHVPADYQRRFGRQVVPDRVHNGALDVAVSFGLAGLGLYLALAVWVIRLVGETIRRGDGFDIGVAAAVAGYLAQQVFLFPLSEVDPVLWVMIGMLAAATRPESVVRFRPAVWARVAIAVVVAVAAVAGVMDVNADRLAREARTLEAAGRHTDAVGAAERAAGLRPDSIRYAFAAADIAARPGGASDLEAAVSWLERALDLSLRDPLLRSTRAGMMLDLARVTGASDDAAEARAVLETDLVDDPHNAELWLRLGVARLATGDASGAETAWLTAADLAPAAVEPLTDLARLYLELGHVDAARDMLERASTLAPDDPTVAALIGRLESNGRQRGPEPDRLA